MHELYLKQALALAEIRRGFCAPNPAVGAVVVKDNQVLTSGYHYASGYPHAEVDALNKIDPSLSRGATIYVTLEPCCHYGKTPPCTDLLIKTGIKCVVYGMRDLNPQVVDKSEQILKNAGMEVIYLPLPDIEKFYRSYNFWWQTKMPYVTGKIALSMDGKIAGEKGERVNLTGKIANQFTHQQRKRSDAILTTAKTILCDNPLLNVRLPEETLAKTIYVLDRQLITPLAAKIFHAAKKVILFHAKNNQEKINGYLAKGAHCIGVTAEDGKLNLREVLQYIGKDGVHDLWVEAGGKCFESFLLQNLMQQAFVYIAPKWLGDNAQTAFSSRENIFKRAKQVSWQNLGNDALVEFIFS